jgi:hydroxymethylbilane synthase
MERRVIRIGTRGSALALWQARYVQSQLEGPSELVIIRTKGDQRQDVRLDLVGGVGLFTREIERALLDEEIDLAVHSLKDLPVEQPPGLVLGATPPRAPVSDLLLIRPEALDPSREIPLKEGALVGTSSTRRVALLAGLRPDLRTEALRGNVPTRIKKCAEGRPPAAFGGADRADGTDGAAAHPHPEAPVATLLARAGLERLEQDLMGLEAFELNPAFWPCAPGQGALGLEIRVDDQATARRLAPLNHPETQACVETERRLLQISGGGCHSAFGAWASEAEGAALLHMALLTPEGALRLRRFEGPALDAIRDEAAAWLRDGAPEVEPLLRHPEDWLCRPAPAWS